MNYNNQKHSCNCKLCEVDKKINWNELTLRQKLEMYGYKKLKYLSHEMEILLLKPHTKAELIDVLIERGVTEKNLPIRVTNFNYYNNIHGGV